MLPLACTYNDIDKMHNMRNIHQDSYRVHFRTILYCKVCLTMQIKNRLKPGMGNGTGKFCEGI
jgi:hypothetical protein